MLKMNMSEHTFVLLIIIILHVTKNKAFITNDYTSSNQIVNNLILENYHKTVLKDTFPVHFKCKFSAFNKTFEILFERTLISNENNLQFKLEKFKNLLNKHRISTNNSELKLYQNYIVKKAKIWDELSKDNALASGFGVLFNTRVIGSNEHNYRIWFSFNIETPLLSIKYDVFPAVEFQHDYYRISQTILNKLYSKRHKRQSHVKHKKFKLTVNSIVHIDYSTFNRYKSLLNIDDEQYIDVYLLILFSHAIASVSNIYERIDHDWFSIRVRLIDIVIDHQIKPFLKMFYSDDIKKHKSFIGHLFFNSYSNYFYNQRNNPQFTDYFKKMKIGHYFIITSIKSGLGGLANPACLCDYSSFISASWDVGFFSQTIFSMAHELVDK